MFRRAPSTDPNPRHCRDPLLDESVVLLNGLITNDKFCLSRVSRQKLRYARRAGQTSVCCEYPRDEGHRGGADEATVDHSSSVSTDHGRGAAVGSGLPASAGMDSTASLAPFDGTGGEV